jgi:hypothetical protein
LHGEVQTDFLIACFPFHQRIHHVRIGQRGGVADLVGLVLGDLAQDAAHDFAGARLRQAGRELDFVRHGNRADFLADVRGEFLFQFFAFGMPSLSVTKA